MTLGGCVAVFVCVCVMNAYAAGVYFGEFWVLMVHKYSECVTAGFCVSVCGVVQQQLRSLERFKFGNCSLPAIPAGLGS